MKTEGWLPVPWSKIKYSKICNAATKEVRALKLLTVTQKFSNITAAILARSARLGGWKVFLKAAAGSFLPRCPLEKTL